MLYAQHSEENTVEMLQRFPLTKQCFNLSLHKKHLDFILY